MSAPVYTGRRHNAFRGRSSVVPSDLLSIFRTWHFENEWTDFAASGTPTRQDDEMINFRGQKVKDQGHTTPKLDLEA